jgi:hypothetical protein
MMPYSAKLQQFVEELLARHRASPEELQLQLLLADTEVLVISQSTDRRQVRLNRLVVMYKRPPVKDLEIAFFVDDEGHWIPYLYYRPPTDHQVCGVIDTRYSKLVIDNPSYQRALASQCDLWATRLRNQGWLEQGTMFSTAGMASDGLLLWPVPTVEEPDEDQLEAWMIDDVCEATDGCIVEPDGMCPHGHPSWLLRLGLI